MELKYNSKIVEANKNAKWIAKGFFSTRDIDKKPFCIMLPPPNVTGKLHLGHAWDGYIQDSIIRYHKLKGYDVLFLPSMDHAGIATQIKVEAMVKKNENKTRFDFSREEFINKIWDWKHEYENNIEKQWGSLGLALDYTNKRFTLDESMNQIVADIFIKMYHDKLIYKDKKAIYYDPIQKTTLSNIEVINKKTTTTMYYFRYPILNEKEAIIVATTRPETMFSDVAIAINPLDTKLAMRFGNKSAISPLTNKILPIIFDDSIEIDKGTGAMKVSAHSMLDFEIMKKHCLIAKDCIGKDGQMNHLAKQFQGLDRFIAREKIVLLLDKEGKLVKSVKGISKIGYSQRSNSIVEVIISNQWFVKTKPLAKLIFDNIKSNEKVVFFPPRFEKTLVQWMEKIYDWVISRQLWWGHRIPAWYKGQEMKVQKVSPGINWVQDNDVLDTWFSSALAPFAFLKVGINAPKSFLQRFYPINLLVTGYDILFFWVAKMYFQGLYFTKQIPFKNVLLHGLIRDEKGNKMSKSLNNGIDPIDVIDNYGSDSLRFFLLTNSSPGNDIRYSSNKIMSSWNLCNKIWNIVRYVWKIMPNGNGTKSEYDNWIQNKLITLQKEIEKRMKNYDFTLIGKNLLKFLNDDLSSWYIEFSKESPNRSFALKIIERVLIILHPFLPFVSDHLYHLITQKEILDQTWPIIDKNLHDKNYHSIEKVIKIIKILRQHRDSNHISKKVKVFYWSFGLNSLETKIIKRMANAELQENQKLLIENENIKVWIILDENKTEEKIKKLNQQISKIKSELERSLLMLNNHNFLLKAPQVKISLEKEKLKNNEKSLKDLEAELLSCQEN